MYGNVRLLYGYVTEVLFGQIMGGQDCGEYVFKREQKSRAMTAKIRALCKLGNNVEFELRR